MLKYFSRYGEVIDCVVMKNQTTGKSRGFGFVTYRDPRCVEAVLVSGPHILDGRQVRKLKVHSLLCCLLYICFFPVSVVDCQLSYISSAYNITHWYYSTERDHTFNTSYHF